MKRILGGRNAIKYYEAGMDLGLSDDIEQSFRLFQGQIIDEYEKMVDEFGLVAIDGPVPSTNSKPRCAASLPRHWKEPILFDGAGVRARHGS